MIEDLSNKIEAPPMILRMQQAGFVVIGCASMLLAAESAGVKVVHSAARERCVVAV
jgi:hypothetical protein